MNANEYYNNIATRRMPTPVVIDELSEYSTRYSNIRGVGMRVRARVAAGIAVYDRVHLDNLLAWAVVAEATQGRMLCSDGGPFMLPLPLKRLWTSESGLPLWASTVFLPNEQNQRDVAYLHKRLQTGRFTDNGAKPLTLHSTRGRWMDRQVPQPVEISTQWCASAVGDIEEVRRLLTLVTHIGKRRGAGFGEILSWSVEEATDPFAIATNGILDRPIPYLAIGDIGIGLREEPVVVGWTPPQWLPELHALGWPAGSVCCS